MLVTTRVRFSQSRKKSIGLTRSTSDHSGSFALTVLTSSSRAMEIVVVTFVSLVGHLAAGTMMVTISVAQRVTVAVAMLAPLQEVSAVKHMTATSTLHPRRASARVISAFSAPIAAGRHSCAVSVPVAVVTCVLVQVRLVARMRLTATLCVPQVIHAVAMPVPVQAVSVASTMV